MIEYIGAGAAGMAILASIAGLVYLILKLTMEPVKDTVKELKTELDKVKESSTSTPLGQKVHDLAGTMQQHTLFDDKRFEDLKKEIADSRKENSENFAQLRTEFAGFREELHHKGTARRK